MKSELIASWVIAVVLALAFFGVGMLKLTSQPMMVANFAGWGFPSWFLCVTGAIEATSAILLLIPRTALVGAGLLVCTMIGALLTHLTHRQAAMIVAPGVLLILLLAFVWLRGRSRALSLSAAS